MAAQFDFASGDVIQYAAAIKKQYHPRLRDNKIIVIWRTDADFGHMAIAKVVPPEYRFLMNCDAILFVHKGAWTDNLNEQQKAYWIDHALTMIDTNDKFMDDGRPKLVTSQPIKVGFANVIQRHGLVTSELKVFRNAVLESGQMDIFDMLQEFQVHADTEQYIYSGYRDHDEIAAASADGGDPVEDEQDDDGQLDIFTVEEESEEQSDLEG